uniref:Uncharacterized protein n=1 Tax=Rhizophora mucronata TaxID=61149 RepID=A0A2P2Q008_RHIMU
MKCDVLLPRSSKNSYSHMLIQGMGMEILNMCD